MSEMTELKLGKLPARVDGRTLRLASIFRKSLAPPPASFNVDASLPVPMSDSNMYLNDQLGDCVIAGRAHMTLRFEDYEQKAIIPITDDDVRTEYMKETGGVDSGLVMLNSLKAWRNGWTAAGQTYNIDAFGALTPSNQQEVMQTIYLLRGTYTGVLIYQSDMDQYNAGQPWSLTPTPGRFLGGHCIYVLGYDADGLTCVTWGKIQRMTWPWFVARTDETYGVVDNRDKWLGADSPIDVAILDNYLAEITGQQPTPPNPPAPPPPHHCCPFLQMLHERRRSGRS